jgi:hypothetical protein
MLLVSQPIMQYVEKSSSDLRRLDNVSSQQVTNIQQRLLLTFCRELWTARG